MLIFWGRFLPIMLLDSIYEQLERRSNRRAIGSAGECAKEEGYKGVFGCVHFDSSPVKEVRNIPTTAANNIVLVSCRSGEYSCIMKTES